jgi:serine protease AprX
MKNVHLVRSLAASLVLLAGAAATVQADYTLGSPTLVKARSGTSLALPGGSSFHTTANPVLNASVFGVAGTATKVVTWQEQKPGGGLTNHYAIALDGTNVAAVRATEYTIPLAYAAFEPSKGEPPVAANLDTPAGNTAYLVQFKTVPLEIYTQTLQAMGAEIVGYVPDETQIVRMSAEVRAKVQGLAFVRWTGALKPAYKVEESVRAWIATAPESGGQRFNLAMLTDDIEEQNKVAAAIQAMGGTVHLTSPGLRRMEATLTPEQVVAASKMNQLDTIDPWGGPGGHDMNLIRQVGGVVPLLSGLNILGQGVRGEVFDTETQLNHTHWSGQAPLLHNINGNSGSHGTACYGINFATAVAGNATGLLPNREQGIFCWYPQTTQFGGATTRLVMNTEATNPAGAFRSCYQTSSVGSTQITTYTAISQETDDYLFKVDYLSCQSQSNLGTQQSRPQAWAKNIVSVGASEMKETVAFGDDSFSGASIGPAADGRVKPDLCHSYSSIFTSWPTNTTTQFSGTSGATPIVAGHFGLLHQMWHQGVWAGFGGAPTVFESRPKSTTAKALMVNGSYRYPLNQGSLTRARQGWGVPQLNYLYNTKDVSFIVNETDLLAPLATNSYCIDVAAGTAELRVTMVYADPAPTVLTGPNRVNDLSLKVTAPGGATFYWGNNGLNASNFSSSGGVANTIDTVENVFLQSPAAGQWTVEVVGTSIVKDSHVETGALDADYALVVTGGVQCKPSGCYPDCDGDGLLTIDDFICFQTFFAIADPYADCDGDGVLTIDDFICFQTFFAIGC